MVEKIRPLPSKTVRIKPQETIPQKKEKKDQKMSFTGPLKLKIVLKDKSGSDLPRHKIFSFSKITLSKIYRSILEDNLSPQP